MTAAIGHERVGRLHWLGAVLSTAGIYFVVGHGAAAGGGTLFGDLLMLRRRRVLVDLHDRRRPADVPPLAALRHRHDDGDRHGAVRARWRIPTLLRLDWSSVSATVWLFALPVRPVRAELRVSRLVHGRAEARSGPDVDLFERGSARRDDHRGDLSR